MHLQCTYQCKASPLHVRTEVGKVGIYTIIIEIQIPAYWAAVPQYTPVVDHWDSEELYYHYIRTSNLDQKAPVFCSCLK